ncbi:MAG: thioredoxin [Kiritimatiellia bacterium]|jgi:thioredoxin
METVDCLDEAGFDDAIAEGRVVVDFYNEACAPCEQMAPMMEDLAQELAGTVKFFKVNTAEHADLAADYNIRSVPTFMLFEDGEKRSQVTGTYSREQFVAWVKI